MAASGRKPRVKMADFGLIERLLLGNAAAKLDLV